MGQEISDDYFSSIEANTIRFTQSWRAGQEEGLCKWGRASPNLQLFWGLPGLVYQLVTVPRKEQEGGTGTQLTDACVAQRVQSNKQATIAQTAEQATAGYGRKVKNALDMV